MIKTSRADDIRPYKLMVYRKHGTPMAAFQIYAKCKSKMKGSLYDNDIKRTQ